MTTQMKNIVIVGITNKLNRGEDLETILSAYVNLTEVEKNEIRNHFEP